MERSKDITREKIVEAASIVFSKYGYKKTTLDDIAAVTNVSKTGLYYYFKNKEEVFNEVIKREACNLQKELKEAVGQQSRPIDKMFAYIKKRTEFLSNVSNYYSTLKHDLHEHLKTIKNNRQDFDKIELEILAEILNEGNATGDFSVDDPESTAQTILLVLISIEIPLFGSDETDNYEDFLDKLINLCLYGIIPR